MPAIAPAPSPLDEELEATTPPPPELEATTPPPPELEATFELPPLEEERATFDADEEDTDGGAALLGATLRLSMRIVWS